MERTFEPGIDKLMNLQIPHFTVEDNGVEPLTPCVQGRCSGQLS